MPEARTATAKMEHNILPLDAEAQVEVKRVSTIVTVDHVENGRWARFRDPVSLAIRELLNENSCCDVFWQSDGWRPRYSDDEADIGIYTEIYDENGKFIKEMCYKVRLPRRAEKQMRRVAGVSSGIFEPVPIAVDIPVMSLR